MPSLPQSFAFDGVGIPSHTPKVSSSSLRVSVHLELADVLDLWGELEATTPHSIYQTRKWLVPWIETIGAASGVAPFFVVLRDRFHAPVGLLPLGLVRRGVYNVAIFLGGKDSNFNMGLIRPEIGVTPDLLRQLLRKAARALGRQAPAFYALQNQPLRWEGAANILARLPHQPAPSFAYETDLQGDPDAFFATLLSKDTRKKLRKKESRLANFGTLTHLRAGTDEEAALILATFFRQKQARLRGKNIACGMADAATQTFFMRISAPSRGSDAAAEVHALACGDRIVATFVGSTCRGRFSGLVNSFDEDPEIAKSSPGDLLLTKLIAAKCAEGVTAFDLGIGEARYKDTFCPTPVPMIDCLVAATLPGHLLRQIEGWRLQAKGTLKHSLRTGGRLGRLYLGATRVAAAFKRRRTA